MTKKAVTTNLAPAPIGPYSQAVVCNGVLYASGQIGIEPQTGEMAEGDVEAQAKQVFKNLEAVLNAAGCNWNSVLKTTIFLADLNDFPKVNALYGKLFSSAPPARSTLEAAGLPKGALIEVGLIAEAGKNSPK